MGRGTDWLLSGSGCSSSIRPKSEPNPHDERINTVVCSNFKYALKFYNKFRIHFVATDIFMNGMGGIEGIRRLK